MENAIVQAGARGLQLCNYQEMMQFSNLVIDSKLAPDAITSPQAAFIAVQTGAEVGLSPMQSLYSVNIIKNRPTLSAESMKSLVMASGLCEEFTEEVQGTGDAMVATVTARRVGYAKPCISRFGMADAKRAGLDSNNMYKKYPQRMLLARARSFACRDLWPDVTKGLLSTEEAREIKPAKQTAVEVVDEPHVEYDAAAELRAENERRYHALKQNLKAFDAKFFSGVAADNGYPPPKDCTQEQVAELLTIVEEAAEAVVEEAPADA